MKNYNVAKLSYYYESDEGYIGYKLMFNTLKFLPERVKIKKVEKLVTNLQDKTEYVIHMKI